MSLPQTRCEEKSMTKKSIIWIGLIIALGIAAIRVYFPSTTQLNKNAQSDHTSITVDKKTLDFGEVWEQKHFSHRLLIKNTTDQPIDLTDIKSSCSCTRILEPNLSIPARDSIEIPLEIDFTKSSAKVTNEALESFEVMITARILNSEGPPLSWTISGQVKSFAIVSIRELYVGEKGVYEQFEPRAFELFTKTPEIKIIAFCDKEHAIAAAIPDTVDKAKYSIQVDTRRRSSIGRFEFPLIIQGIFPDGKRTNPIKIPVVGNVTGDIEVIPNRLVFVPAPVDAQRQKTIRMRSASKTPFEVEYLLPAKSNVTAAAQSKGNQTEHSIDVNVHVSDVGEHKSTLAVFVRDSVEKKRIRYDIPLVWIGLKNNQ